MLNLILNFFLNIFRWLFEHVVLGIIVFWLLGKALGYSFKKTAARETNHKKFWLSLMLILILLYISLKEGWIHLGL